MAGHGELPESPFLGHRDPPVPHSWAGEFPFPPFPVLHSLWYQHMAVSEPSPGVPQFMSVGFLDGIPFMRYDSERGRMEPQTPWMGKGPEPGFWDGETKIAEVHQHWAADSLETLRVRNNHSRGLHTLQWVSGCDLLSDGTFQGSDRYSYNGRDFLSSELGSKNFVPANVAAQVTKRKGEYERIEVEEWIKYLGLTCPEWLQIFIRYGQEALERKEPPDVHVSGKEEHGILTLSCHAYGFYPGIIGISWMKGDEIWDQETEWGGVVPNSDGTFHSRARIEALPGEWEQYRCRVEHAGMPEPGIFAWVRWGFVSLSSHFHPSQSQNPTGIPPQWWSPCPSSLPSSSSASWDSVSGSFNPGTGRGMDTTQHLS
ncbi:class I histocompatibility antigen, F10 alpha chain-like isoform X1 [Pithys albifrons albifrons]|uniref:class I histocompatibility antigen, F10 alpha chain-like isoform X1 n=1 Tax=Pithys albifrons albifrons TaxID=3385563 RepID=UPI003A5D12BE